MVKGPLHGPPPPPPEPKSASTNQAIQADGLSGQLWYVVADWRSLVMVGLGRLVALSSEAVLLGVHGRAIWIGLAKSICASFNRSTVTVSVLPPMSILKVLGPVSMTLYGPV